MSNQMINFTTASIEPETSACFVGVTLRIIYQRSSSWYSLVNRLVAAKVIYFILLEMYF